MGILAGEGTDLLVLLALADGQILMACAGRPSQTLPDGAGSETERSNAASGILKASARLL